VVLTVEPLSVLDLEGGFQRARKSQWDWAWMPTPPITWCLAVLG
jgi:hypothetical protein